MSFVIWAIGIGLSLWLAVNLFVFLFQESLIFQGEEMPEDLTYSFEGHVEEIFLRPDSSSQIHALHFKVDEPQGVIVYFHGNRGDLSRWGYVAKDFTTLGYDVVMMDYRGYGKSRGVRTEEAIYWDAEMLLNHVKEKSSYDRIVYYGRSLGSGVAVHLATMSEPELLLLETPFTRLSDAIESFHVISTLALNRFKLNSGNKIGNVKSPLVIFHGTDDRVVPYQYGEALYHMVTSDQKKLVTIPKGQHNNLNSFAVYHQMLKAVLQDGVHQITSQ